MIAERPEQVTSENWGQLQAKGTKHMANCDWPLTPRAEQFIRRLCNEHGPGSVLLGHPYHGLVPTDLPSNYGTGKVQVGVYVCDGTTA